MAPKRKTSATALPPKTILLGRPGASLKMGIVGLPNVGKSSFFNVISHRQIPAENRPFCTIDPNMADTHVPDPRFDLLCEIHKPKSAVPAQLQVFDIAGLVSGASEGEGLGNAFLSHVTAVDGIYHMCRAFDDEEVVHIEGDVDPVRDLEIIFRELVMKDMQFVDTMIAKLTPVVSRGLDRTKVFDLEVMHKVRDVLEQSKQIRCVEWSTKEIDVLNSMQLLTAKPAVFLVNLSERDYRRQRNKYLPRLKAWIDEQTGEQLIPFSASFETTLTQLPEGEVEGFLKGSHSQVSRTITAGYHAINLIHFFTSGEDEVKCWTIQRNWKAPQAAGRIHTDMERGFICAEVCHWNDFDELRSDVKIKEAGLLHQEGRNYVVQDGDILHIKFNPPRGGGKK